MTRDLELSQPGHLVFGPALATDQVHLELVDVLRLRRRRAVVERAGSRTRERSTVRDAEPPDEVGERDGGGGGEPPVQRFTVAVGRVGLARVSFPTVLMHRPEAS